VNHQQIEVICHDKKPSQAQEAGDRRAIGVYHDNHFNSTSKPQTAQFALERKKSSSTYSPSLTTFVFLEFPAGSHASLQDTYRVSF
jgi:hypothetical protein